MRACLLVGALLASFMETVLLGEWFFAHGNGRPPTVALFACSVVAVWLWIAYFVAVSEDG